MNKLKNTKGITLIALVITIIVLLILAGVTIAMLTGDNGLLTKAQSSKDKNDEASVEEKIKLAVMYSRMNTNGDSEINLVELEDELKRNFNNDVSIDKKGADNNLPWYVSNNGYMFEIKEDGTVGKARGIALSKTQIKVLKEAETQEITATLTPGISGTITWLSDNTDVAEVNPTTGNTTTITFKNYGTAKITASIDDDTKATCDVNVLEPLNSISLIKGEEEITTISIQAGKEETIIAKAKGESGTLTKAEELIASVNNDKITSQITNNLDGTFTIKLKADKDMTLGENVAKLTVSGKTTTTIAKECNITVIKPTHAVRELPYTWEKIEKIAKAISNNPDINNETLETTVNVDGEDCFVGMGDYTYVTIGENSYKVRIIGFKHDELVDRTQYGSDNRYAGITFEFVNKLAVSKNYISRRMGKLRNKDTIK